MLIDSNISEDVDDSVGRMMGITLLEGRETLKSRGSPILRGFCVWLEEASMAILTGICRSSEGSFFGRKRTANAGCFCQKLNPRMLKA